MADAVGTYTKASPLRGHVTDEPARTSAASDGELEPLEARRSKPRLRRSPSSVDRSWRFRFRCMQGSRRAAAVPSAPAPNPRPARGGIHAVDSLYGWEYDRRGEARDSLLHLVRRHRPSLCDRWRTSTAAQCEA